MTIAAPALPRAHQDVWHKRYGPALVLALVFLPFAVALVWASSRPAVDSIALSASIAESADVVDEHAAAMIRVGLRVAAAARAANDRAWTAYGEHLISDGHSLESLASSLRDTAVVAARDPMHAGRVDVAAAFLEAQWERLRLDGQATALHGRVMVEQARTMAGAPRSIVSQADLAELEAVSAGMVEAGERAVRVAETLLGSVDQMRRWLGVGR